MITHYDMITGEVIEDEYADRAVESIAGADLKPAMCLVDVQEDAGERRAQASLPADIAMLPVGDLLAEWE